MYKEEEKFPIHKIDIAVLLLIFKRLDTTKVVFEAIRKAKPSRLYIASDGPRSFSPKEREEVKIVRDYVINSINWDCRVKTLFRDKNLGCKYAVSDAISWFFKNEKMGIILEDDCLPSQSFFRFCSELLEKYKNDKRIMSIAGHNYGISSKDDSYYFSKYIGIWGWATWKRSWKYFDISMESFKEFKQRKFLNYIFPNRCQIKERISKFSLAYSNSIDSWGYIWSFSVLKNNGLSIKPNINLIKNIGFSKDATHTRSINQRQIIPNLEIKFPLKNPDFILADYEADIKYYKRFLERRFISKVKRYYGKLFNKNI